MGQELRSSSAKSFVFGRSVESTAPCPSVRLLDNWPLSLSLSGRLVSAGAYHYLSSAERAPSSLLVGARSAKIAISAGLAHQLPLYTTIRAKTRELLRPQFERPFSTFIPHSAPSQSQRRLNNCYWSPSFRYRSSRGLNREMKTQEGSLETGRDDSEKI